MGRGTDGQKAAKEWRCSGAADERGQCARSSSGGEERRFGLCAVRHRGRGEGGKRRRGWEAEWKGDQRHSRRRQHNGFPPGGYRSQTQLRPGPLYRDSNQGAVALARSIDRHSHLTHTAQHCTCLCTTPPRHCGAAHDDALSAASVAAHRVQSEQPQLQPPPSHAPPLLLSSLSTSSSTFPCQLRRCLNRASPATRVRCCLSAPR